MALYVRKLIDTYNLTQERLSERLGKKRATIANHLRLLKLPAEIQLGLRDGKLDMGHARALLSLDNAKQQLKLFNLIIKNDLSVRKVEEMVKKAAEGKSPKEVIEKKEAYDEIERQLSDKFFSKVKISRRKDGQGSVIFNFKSEQELDSLMNLFGISK